MRIGVLGNCQSRGFAESLRRMHPDAELLVVPITALTPGDDFDASAGELAACDILFAQQLRLPEWGALRTEAIVPRARRHIAIPEITFTGLHPDSLYLKDAAGRDIHGPIGPYHSALAVAGFLEGLSPERTLRLFNAHSYARLGYFTDHAAETKRLAARLEPLGFDLAEALRDAPAVFMHTANHPKIEVLFSLARQALRVAGLPFVPAGMPHDELATMPVWAVYPEIARRLGVAPGDFRIQGRTLTIAEMVHASYEAFAKRRPHAVPPAAERARAFIREHVLGLPVVHAEAPVTAQDVQNAYRQILGRPAEPAAVEHCVRMKVTVGRLRAILLGSPEFTAQYARLTATA
jgi:hypothetical protein